MKKLLGALFGSIMAISAGCGGGSAEGGTTAESAAAYAGPVASNDAGHGEARFGAICGACHQAHEMSSLAWDPGRMRQQVREGSGRMAPIRVARLSDEDLEAVLAYLVTTGAVIDEGGSAGGAEETLDDTGADDADPAGADEGAFE